MMGHILNLMRWEWFKLRKRRMPWVILALFLAYPQLGVWVSYLSYRTQPDGETYASFTLPQSLLGAANVACSFLGIPLIIIFTASVIGTEYQWGTIRPVLAKGTGRWQYLTSKVLLLWLLVAGAVLIIMALTAVSSLIAGALAGGAPEGASASASWVDVPIAFGKASFVLLPYMALATLFTVLTTSWAIGMAISLGYYLVEYFVTLSYLSVPNVPKWVEIVFSFVLGINVQALLIAGHVSAAGDTDIGEILDRYPGAPHAFLVLMVYILLFGGLTLWIFQRRDVAPK
jgi:ABC-2 type transport system permease protein